jgi:hypothetical protein
MKFEYNPDLPDHPFVLIAPWERWVAYTQPLASAGAETFLVAAISYCRLIFCCFIHKCLIASMKEKKNVLPIHQRR